MNMQSLMKQAQKIQSDMSQAQKEIDKTIYEGNSSIVSVKIDGKKIVKEVKIDADMVDKDDIELLQDMFLVAINDAMTKVNNDIEKKLGKYTQGLPGIF